MTPSEIKRRIVQADERSKYWLSVSNIVIENSKSQEWR